MTLDFQLEPAIRRALEEDLGTQGDITTLLTIPAEREYHARLQSRDDGVVSGMQVARIAFHLVDPSLEIVTRLNDGTPCAKGDVLMEIKGNARSILSGERVALNFAGRMSGIATKTAAFVAEAKGTHTRVTCTRKTTPGLRVFEKAAVAHGGGANHRYGLDDAILIKDNHIAAAGGIAAVLDAVKAKGSHMMRVEIEVDRLDQLEEVLAIGGADCVLLDNMDNETLKTAVGMVGGQMITEASGNMRLERIAGVAATGVDFISVGALTHSARTLDLGLDF